jgi:3-isopropylmalate/(R)-2-methylmalate dehydratase large subunit
MAGKTIIDKIWDAHVVAPVDSHSSILYIDRHYIHEVTSPQAFSGLRKRGLKVLRPAKTVATADHNVPTADQHLSIRDELSRMQVDTLTRNCREHGIELYGLNHPYNGIVHVIGPELGLTLPGMTIVCGDSHTSTHGAFGTIAFGIGTSEVEMVLASQCLILARPLRMRITVDGNPGKGVGAKDIILYIISQISTSGATGYFVEFAGEAVRSLTMEGRMTLCNMSIEMGARGGLIAPDEVTFSYLKGRKHAPGGDEQDNSRGGHGRSANSYSKTSGCWDKALAYWKTLPTDSDALFDKELLFDASEIQPMITYGTNPGMGVSVTGHIPLSEEVDPATRATFLKSISYMGFQPGDAMLGKPVDYVFAGSCTNGRIEDLRLFASLVKGRKKAGSVTAWIVPGSKQVEAQAEKEGLRQVLEEAGFELRQPGCSACLAMNEDKVPPGKTAVSTSNRNFEGRQGPGARTLLASPLTAAAAAITGRITDPRDFL